MLIERTEYWALLGADAEVLAVRRRANAVRNFLIALNVDASRISTVSYGKERPVALGSNVTAWALNRRAVSQIEGGPAVN